LYQFDSGTGAKIKINYMPIINVKQTRQVYAESESRRAIHVLQINEEITRQAVAGRRIACFPPDVSDLEALWLSEELVLAGYTVNTSDRTVKW
jgi:hypothetical protein